MKLVLGKGYGGIEFPNSLIKKILERDRTDLLMEIPISSLTWFTCHRDTSGRLWATPQKPTLKHRSDPTLIELIEAGNYPQLKVIEVPFGNLEDWSIIETESGTEYLGYDDGD